MVDKISSLDTGYITGDLSLYPEAKDSKDTLYDVKNNAETSLKQGLTITANFIIVNDASTFPDKGILCVGRELIYYDSRTSNVFKSLKRGFAGSVILPWQIGTKVTNVVAADPHNAIKDALINIQTNIGLKENPSSTSLNGILSSQESRFLAPKPSFRGFPLVGPPPLKVRFQNFSGGEPIRYFWDFGDGTNSTDESPIHTYTGEGIYTVKLQMINITKGQGITTKFNYIRVSESETLPLFYVEPLLGNTSTEFNFIDQTDGDIIQRYWIFDDGNKTTIEDGDIHTASHIYSEPGEYNPTLLIVFSNTKTKVVNLDQTITVI